MSPTIEINGVQEIPEIERTGKPGSLFSIFLGSNLSLSVMVFGWLSILYGLSWWQSVTAILLGTFLGSVFISVSSLFGWKSATNNSVTSGRYFGVKGRLVASFIGLLLCIQYVALTVWTGGEMLSAGWAKLIGGKESDGLIALGYGIIAVAIISFAILGYRWIVTLNNYVAYAMVVLIAICIYAFYGSFDSSYPGDPNLYALANFWPTWLLAVLTCGVAGPISYVTQTGDWTRYISANSTSSKKLILTTFLALFVGLTLPTIFGAFIATASFDENSFATGFVAGSPNWLLLPLLLIALIGSLGQGSINLYSMGLDLDAILPRLSRLKSTVLVAGVSTGLVFIGKFIYDAEAAVTNSVLFLTSMATSWFVISLYGYFKTFGRFTKSDLQVFNQRTTGGLYWYSNGWNYNAVLAWLIGSTMGIIGISSVDYLGPLSSALSQVDVSVLAAALFGLSSFIVFEKVKPTLQV